MTEWLTSVGLEKYAARFEEQEITLDLLAHLTEADIDALGLPIGPRRRLMVELARIKDAEDVLSSSNPRADAPKTTPPSSKSARSSTGKASSSTPGKAPSSKGPSSSSKSAREHGAERRQLTVMFCDLVGSTALAEKLDPEELRELIRSYRSACGEIAERYEAHVAQYLGDGLMIYFGWPTAHEDEAQRGALAAIEMVAAVRALPSPHPLAIRIGLATGAVVVGESSDSDDAEARLAIGETPNLAARLQSLAKPDEIVIAHATRRLLGDGFALSDLGEHVLKGFALPVPAFRVDAIKRTEGRFEAAHAGMTLSPLVGRAEETTEMLRVWQSALACEGSAVAIQGEPGIGKSRLMQAFREGIRVRHEVVQIQCSPYHVNSALHPVIEHLESAAGFTRDDSVEQKLGKLDALLGRARLDVPTSAALLAPLFSLPADRYPKLTLSPQKRKERTLDTIARFLEMRARESALLFVVEDTHWIDPTSEELLELLLSRIARLPLMMVTTHRPERAPAWFGRPGVGSVALTRLDRQDGARIVSGVTMGRPLPPEVLDRILARTDGVPLFVEELTRSLLESGLLHLEKRADGDRWSLRGSFDDASIPTSLRDSLMARLDRLDDAKEIAQIGACIGREFSYRLIAKVAPIVSPGLEEALERLTETGLVTRRDEPPVATYTFKHALVQDAAYDSLLKSRRRELHTAIAQAIEQDGPRTAEPEWIAHHHTQAGNLSEAVPLWRRAGALAVERLALREAVAHFEKGLSLVGQLPPSVERDRLELTIREPLNAAFTGLRGWAAHEVGENAEAILRLTTSHEDSRSQILAMWWMWTTTITQGRIADSLEWARRMMVEGEATLDADLQLFGQAAMMVQHLLQGELVASRDAAARVLAQYDPRRAERWIQLTGYDLRTFVEVYACQLTWMLGYPDQAVKEADAATARARTFGHAFNTVWALTFSAYVHAYRRDDEPLFARVEEADRIAKDQGIAFISQVSVPQARGIAHIHAGRPADALPLLRQGLVDWTSRGGHVRVPYLKSALAEAIALQGDVEDALRLIEECLDQIARPGWQEREWLAEVLRVKAWILLQQAKRGDTAKREDEAERALRASIDYAQRQSARGWELRSATTLANLLASRGERAEAKAVLEPVYGWFTEGFATKDLREARALLDRLAAG